MYPFVLALPHSHPSISKEEKTRTYKSQIDKTVFIVEVEETESAHETAEQKIRKLIEAECNKMIVEERHRLNNSQASLEG